MVTYLLKFSACLVILWLVYVVFLEQQKMHRFKRFYLLGAVAISIIIPFLTIIQYIEPIMDFGTYDPNAIITPPIFPAQTPVQVITESTNYLPIILWSLYGIGAIIFFTRFMINLINLYRNISKNEKIAKHSFVYVLLKEYRIPHSFFKYIFLNKVKYKSKDIPKEVLLHEETHAKQLHSLDILLLEVLQIVFWFHPLIYILKHHIKLNHEFLADQAVLNEGINTRRYQNILLQFSSNTQEQQFASAINYSSFKKRFTVMKTQTSKTRVWLSTLLLLPIIAILFYSFAEREYIESPVEPSKGIKTAISNMKDKDINSDLFLVTVEKNGNNLELKCETGCNWSHLILEPNSDGYIINDYGFSEGKTLDTDQFTFSIKPSENGVELNGLKGTAWIDLAFSLEKNKTQAINHLGMTNYSSSKNEEINKNLQKRAEENYYTKQFFTVKDPNGNYVKKRFFELDYDNKIKWVYAEDIPYTTIDVTQAHFNNIKTSKKYIVKLNGNYIQKDELSNFKASDFITFSYTPISSLAEMNEESVVNLITSDVYDIYVKTMVMHYSDVIEEYEKRISLLKNESNENIKEIVSTFEFLNYNYNRFTSKIIKKYNLNPPTSIAKTIIDKVNESYLDIPILYIDESNNLFLNNKPTSLESLQKDFNNLVKNKKSELLLEANGKRVDNSFVEEIMAAIGGNLINISVPNGQALVFNPDFDTSKSFQDAVKAYNEKFKIYKKLQDTPPHYINKSKIEQKQMEALFSDLGGMYFRMSKANKTKVERPIAPVRPYTKITLNGKTYYKKYENLTKEEKATLPPPPPPPTKNKSKGGPNYHDVQNAYNPSFLEYIIEMEQLGASFYLDNKEIRSEKAKSIAQNRSDKRFEMLTQKDKNGKYIVKLTSSKDKQQQATKKEIEAYNAWAKKMKMKFEKMPESEKINGHPHMINDKTYRYYNSIYKRMNSEQKKKSETLPQAVLVTEWPMPEYTVVETINQSQQEKATKKQIEAYNAWAKKMNVAIKKAKAKKSYEYPIIKKKDVERYLHIYKNLMTEEQRKNAEAWPNIPPPPPPPPTPESIEIIEEEIPAPPPPPISEDASPEEIKRMKKVIEDYKKTHPESITSEKVNGKMIEIVEIPMDQEGKTKIGENEYFYKIKDGVTTYYDRYGNKVDINDIPPPPPPESPIDFVIRMAKKNAKFSYEGKQISSDKAIELIKKNNKLNINAKEKTKDGKPFVVISKKPIVIEVKEKSRN